MRAALVTIAVAAVVAACAGCAFGKAMFTSSGDLADYRSFRVAAPEGVRLGRADRYLARHPRGAWAGEVKRAFDDEEPAYFQKAQASRDKTSEYLADLPRGPHAAAAIALLTAYDAHVEDLETDKLLRQARLTEIKLERASRQRHALGDAILEDVAALLDPGLYGAPRGELPEPARKALGGLAAATWGDPPPVHDEDFFYAVPTHLARESRVVTLRLAVVFEKDRATLGIISGADLFVAWAEADEMSAKDPTSDRDRAMAAAHAADLLSGALEAILPAARCAVSSSAVDEILVRKCDGWSVVVTMGRKQGDLDAVTVSGPPRAPGPSGPTAPKK